MTISQYRAMSTARKAAKTKSTKNIWLAEVPGRKARRPLKGHRI